MRKTVLALGLLSMLVQPLMVLAEDTVVEKSKTEMNYTNPVAEMVILPVRVVTGTIAAPIGAVAGLLTGFGKGFAWPGHAATTETTTIKETKEPKE